MGLLPEFLTRLFSRAPDPAALPGIAVDDLARRIDAGEKFAVVDVRTMEEFSGEAGHIRHAINIDVATLKARTDELRHLRRRTLAVVCLTEKRSAQGVQILLKAGFKRVVLVRGGMRAWQASGLPVNVVQRGGMAPQPGHLAGSRAPHSN